MSACASAQPPVVSGDLSCERFRHIPANDAQRKLIADNWDIMETWAIEVAEHNVEYDRNCLTPSKSASDTRAKSK